MAVFFLLFPGRVNGFIYLFFRKSRELWQKLLAEPFLKARLIINRKERIHVCNRRILPQLVNIVAQHFRIARYNRTVIMISSACILLLFVWSAWIENKFHATLKKRDKMAVAYLSRITYRLGRNGFNPFFVYRF